MEEAIKAVQASLSYLPQSWRLTSALVDLLEANKQPTEGIRALRSYLDVEPDNAECWLRLSHLLACTRQEVKALQAAESAVAADSQWPPAYNRLGSLVELTNPQAALSAFTKAQSLAPQWRVPRFNRSRVLRELGRLDEATVLLRQLVDEQPDDQPAQSALAEALLQQGELAAGWSAYDWRFDCGGKVPPYSGTSAPVWDGAPLAGQVVMVWLEQGLGDQLQFCRYLPWITQLGGRIWLQTPPKLRLLLDSLGVIERFVDEGVVPEGFDLQIPLMSLPNALRSSVFEIPSADRYLASKRALAADLTKALAFGDDVLRVGVVHASRADHPQARRRDCPLLLLSHLAEVPNVRLYNLQFSAEGPAASPSAGKTMVELGHMLGDFEQTAAVVCALDLVITVDTAMAHLCGALGQPVWTLLSTSCDWRWQLRRTDSPWYQSMRLYRQEQQGDWSNPLAAIADDLAALAIARSRS